jgi:3-hydroxy-9,10-secoandrosta-1,3,5(10)-triene-9,17-dione monooxygenase reductase component
MAPELLRSHLAHDPDDGFVHHYLAYLLARASQVVSGEFHASLKAWRLSVAEWRILACLHGSRGLGIGELAAMALMRQPRVSRIVDRMERAGLIERRPHPGDRRRVVLFLTPAGYARVEPAIAAAKAHEARVLGPFSAQERATIKEGLELLIARSAGPERNS